MEIKRSGSQPSAKGPRTILPAPCVSTHRSRVKIQPGSAEAGRIEIELPGEPVAALTRNVRALLLLGMRRLFLKVISWRSKKRQMGIPFIAPLSGSRWNPLA